MQTNKRHGLLGIAALALATLALAPAAFAQGKRVAVTPAEQKKLNVFFSNFSEVLLDSFTEAKPLSQGQLLRFAANHFYLNSKQGKLMTRVRAKAIVKLYFDRTLTAWYAPKGYSMVKGKIDTDPRAAGEESYTSKLIALVALGESRFRAIVLDSGEHGTVLHTKAVIAHRHGRYVLLEYQRG